MWGRREDLKDNLALLPLPRCTSASLYLLPFTSISLHFPSIFLHLPPSPSISISLHFPSPLSPFISISLQPSVASGSAVVFIHR